MPAAKWHIYDSEIFNQLTLGCKPAEITRGLIAKYNLTVKYDNLLNYVSKKTDVQRNGEQIKITVTPSELEILKKHRALAAECEAKGIPAEDVSHYWYKSEDFSLFVKPKQQTYESVKDMIVKDMIKHAPKYPVIKRPKQSKEGLLSVVDIADAHFGKYSSKSETGEHFDLNEAKKRFTEGIDSLCCKLEKEKVEKIVYIGGNDKIHIDNAINTTTSGTKQDQSGLWHEMYVTAKKCEVEALEKLLTIADVHFVHCPSNHDFLMGFFLADTISSHFYNNKNITFDVSPAHRKYMQWGNSLIGATHGDGAKLMDLSDLMKTECKQAWSVSKFAYWYCHHIHHKFRLGIMGSKKIELEKDGRGITILNTGKALQAEDVAHVEYLRTMTGTDRWHSTNGFQYSPTAVEMFLHHKHYGQIERHTHFF